MSPLYLDAHVYQYARETRTSDRCRFLASRAYACERKLAIPLSVVWRWFFVFSWPREAGRPNSVIQTGLRFWWRRFITVRKRRTISITPSGLRVYGCTAAMSNQRPAPAL